jgi:rhodanese-related sulfurtransferase
MRTSDPNIWAVGDAVQVRHFVSGRPALIALAGPANKQGRIAADNVCGIPSVFTGSQGSSVIRLFDLTAASTGLNEKAARAAGLPYDKVITYSLSHAGYYPGATNMTVKVLFQPESGKILGAQIVGFEGVDKRIDVLATAIRASMTAADLTELDLAYAPPFSSAKDPVNMAGYVIENVRAGRVRQWFWDELDRLPRDGSVTLLDVRSAEEFREGHFPGAVNIPLDDLRGRLGELDPQKEIYVNCFSGLRSYLACRILTQHGFSCRNLAGGYHFYRYVAEDRDFCADPTHPCGVPLGR